MAEETSIETLERLLGHRFSDRGLLAQALVHDSFLHENPDTAHLSNERLEFLGDAWLGYVIADELCRRFPSATEGALTKLRAAVVQRATLAGAARGLALGQHLVLGHGEARSGGRDRASTLAAFYEALVGALLLDGGERPARNFVLHSLKAALGDLSLEAPATDPKSALQEYCQARRWAPPSYHVETMTGPGHARRFTVSVGVQEEVLGRGEGPSRREAEKEAARAALERLQGQGVGRV